LEELAKAITKLAAQMLKLKESNVMIFFEDNPKENWYIAGNQL